MMDEETCYEWGELFARGWQDLKKGMSGRASAMGLVQQERDRALVWNRDAREECRWVFVPDPSDLEAVRAVYAREGNVKSPSCFVVVQQPDETDDRGDVIFDIFRLNPQSYLWHFHRVYTRPSTAHTG